MLTVTVMVTVTASVATSHHSIPSPRACVWLLFLLHIFTMAFTFFSPSVVVVVVCVFMFYTSNCCLMCCSPPPTKTSSSRVAQPWSRGNGEWGFRHAEVKFASFFKRLRINFSTIYLDKYECKKAATLLLLSLSPSLCLSLSIASPSRVLD